jgi:hypothetical protein
MHLPAHILPGTRDGAPDSRGSVDMSMSAVAEGNGTAAGTLPHFSRRRR